MKLPNVERATVAERKMTAYLLSQGHRTGRAKAAFFAHFGFTAEAWETLADALKRHAAEHEIVEIEHTRFGTTFCVDGALRAPDGRLPMVRVVWFVENGEANPRLVTAYPLKGAPR